jgi:type IV secretory pathway VirB3-like protein
MTRALFNLFIIMAGVTYVLLMIIFVFAIVLYFINNDALIAVLLWARLTFLYP